ncbi:myeloid cell surface antigen CD33-like isoform X1 [Xiphophorus maculatus]|uniref:myeloid cell surface antigen CD33-like isoform X1 n=1 Tax=Xiphophorus maculatus TaxID=8083 RepID=UPI000C6D2300|nr:myeloid cell surface antigen CD33-like isoform X1 [Xiphophorus maculatus]
MMDLKLWLSFLMVCGKLSLKMTIHGISSFYHCLLATNVFLLLCFIAAMAESHILHKDWLIDVPSRIPVLQSSCVVIPCVYLYPKSRKILNRWRGFWKRGDTIVASNFLNLRLGNEFHHRSRITGTLQSGNCTWQLYGVRETDTGPFYFRIEIPQHKSFTFSKNKVTLDVFRVPKPPTMSVAVQDQVTATCKVTHVCPSSPPKFSWSHSGIRKTRSKKENKWLWSTTSTLTFTPQEADFNMPLNCTVTFPGKKTTVGSVLLIKKSTK